MIMHGRRYQEWACNVISKDSKWYIVNDFMLWMAIPGRKFFESPLVVLRINASTWYGVWNQISRKERTRCSSVVARWFAYSLFVHQHAAGTSFGVLEILTPFIVKCVVQKWSIHSTLGTMGISLLRFGQWLESAVMLYVDIHRHSGR